MKPKAGLGGIVVLVDLPSKNNYCIGELDTISIMDELTPLFDHLEIDYVNITGTMAITVNTTTKDIWKSLNVVKKIAIKHYHKETKKRP